MTESSRPFSGSSPGDAGPFSAAQWARVWQTFFSGFLRDDAGVFWGTGETATDIPLEVTETSPQSGSVEVKIGAALVQGYWYEHDATGGRVQLTPSANNSGNSRIDRVVLSLNYPDQEIRLALSEGTPSATPAAPALIQTVDVEWQIPIAQITLANGFSTLTDSEIVNEQIAVLELPVEMGGTGFSAVGATNSFQKRYVLGGDANGDLIETLKSVCRWGLTGNSSNFGNGSYSDISSASGSMDEIDDDDGLITVASTGATFAVGGLYKIGVVISNILDVGSSVTIGVRIRNVTQGVTLGILTMLRSGDTFSNDVLEGTGVINAGDEIRIQGLYSGGGGSAAKVVDEVNSAGGSVGGETSRSMVCTAQRIAEL